MVSSDILSNLEVDWYLTDWYIKNIRTTIDKSYLLLTLSLLLYPRHVIREPCTTTKRTTIQPIFLNFHGQASWSNTKNKYIKLPSTKSNPLSWNPAKLYSNSHRASECIQHIPKQQIQSINQTLPINQPIHQNKASHLNPPAKQKKQSRRTKNKKAFKKRFQFSNIKNNSNKNQ